jgi:multiple sugar transport system ATP-binding protein
VEGAARARGVTFHARVDVTEWLGNEQFAYVPFDAPADVEAKLRDLALELDSDTMRTQVVASLDTASRITKGEDAELWLDASRMHLFDPVTGDNLTRDLVLSPHSS